MKNHELLDMIGEVNEDYVLEAGSSVTRPRFRWKTLAACAACAALVLAAYPVYRAVNPPARPLHGYTVVERDGVLDAQGDIKAPQAGTDIPAIAPAPAPDPVTDIPAPAPAPGIPMGEPVEDYDVPGQGAPALGTAQAQSAGLRQGLGGHRPDWYGGAWIDYSCYPEARLKVAIVEGFRTAELEARIQEWCGGGVVFQDVKYSREYLFTLRDRVLEVIPDPGPRCSIGVDVEFNRVGVDIFSEDVPDGVLADLARLDPAGDAIRVRVFTGAPTIAGELVKGPDIVQPAADPEPCPTPVVYGAPAPDEPREIFENR